MTVIFSCIAGSHMYGTATETSDVDTRQVEIESVEHILGLQRKDHTVINGEKDETTFTLRFFAKLALENNPNILELLFVDRMSVGVQWSKDWEKFVTVGKSCIPSQLVRKTFVGYAVSQLKRIERHYRWLNTEPPKKPLAEDYGRVVTFTGEKWTDYQLKQEYDADKKLYDLYQTWIKNRNPARSELEKKHGYDCYTDDTLFLTSSGWLRYDDITVDDSLGTLNPDTGQLEFQKYSDRVKKEYNGIIYNVSNKYSECNVTPNHRMYISDAHRGLFGSVYKKEKSNWRFDNLQSLIDNNKSYYHILNSVSPRTIKANISDGLLLLIGAYVSEGAIGYYKGVADELRITQTNKGKKDFFDKMSIVEKEFVCNKYQYNRLDKNLIETTWVFRDKQLINYIINICGRNSKDKKLPGFITTLSKEQSDLLLNMLYLGDGTKKKMGYIYYTQSKELAESVFLLSFLSGRDTKIYGPYVDKKYETDMYQVYFTERLAVPKMVILNHALKKINYKGNIVCFTVPNENLITMTNGKIAVQGNTKHAMHLVRLITEAQYLLTAGYLEFPLPNADFLKEVRNGYFSYPELLIYAKDSLEYIEGMQTDLPKKPDFEKVQNVIIDIYRRYI